MIAEKIGDMFPNHVIITLINENNYGVYCVDNIKGKC